MTSVRAKRNSKAPNRFSSDNARIETSHSTGETIINYDDNTTSTTHSLAPIDRAIKLKPVLREPLKVKLPKLKRSQESQSTKDNTVKSSISEIKIHKIKLPPLSSRKSKAAVGGQSQKTNDFHATPIATTTPTTTTTAPLNNTKPGSSLSPGRDFGHITSSPVKDNNSSSSTHHQLDTSTNSKSSEREKLSSTANSSFESEDDDVETSRMEIVVTKPEVLPSGSGIRCPCGVDDDLGVMVECESCSTWQHGHCINVGTEEEAYEGYICAYCVLPQDKARDSLSQLTVDDRFRSKLELFVKRLNPQDGAEFNSCKEFSQSDQLTIEELSQASQELCRVFNSLKVKWRLFTSEAYEIELRIWQNPYWSDKQQENVDQEKCIYFMDRCKSNLKINIRNIVIKLEERCRLIDQAVTLISSATNSNSNEREFILNNLEKVSQGVQDIKNKLKNDC